MDRQHLNTELTGGSHRTSNSVWDVVELQIKKNLFSSTSNFIDQARPRARKYFEADLEESHMAGELVYGAKRCGAIRNIQGYDKF
jgi:hypothetical protein